MTSVLKRTSKKGKPQESGTGKTWIHPAESLQQGSVVYSVKLLGATDVAQAKGTDIVREAIKKVKFANHIKKSEAGVKGSKLKKVELKISIDNIKVEDVKTKEELYSYPLHRISYCADDKRDKKLFAFIAKDSGQQHHNCYVFECEKMAEELTLTVGQAFDLAYRRFLERKSVNEKSQKKLTEMEEKIKTAEDEKEALKQKIAELEVAASQGSGPPSSNGSNEGNRLDEFDLLGGFGVPSVMPAPQPQDMAPPPQQVFPQETIFDPFAEIPPPQPQTDMSPPPQQVFPQETGGQETMFDPFAEIPPPQPQTAVPTSPDFNEFTPQPVYATVSRPSTKGVVPVALPPPPTKESVKAANRMKTNSGNVTPVTSPPPPAVYNLPVSQPAPSNDLLQLSGGHTNPFSSGVNGTDPFSDNLFDPFASKNNFFDSGKEINQNIPSGFPSDLVLH